jgi:DNA-binding transcriptional LysR family regulator
MSGSTWIFPTSPSETRVEVRARYQVDNGDAIADAAIAGLGVAYQPDFILGPRVASGALVRLLPGVPTFEGSFWVLTPTRRRSAATAAFVEHLIAGLDDPGHQQQIVVR